MPGFAFLTVHTCLCIKNEGTSRRNRRRLQKPRGEMVPAKMRTMAAHMRGVTASEIYSRRRKLRSWQRIEVDCEEWWG